MGCPFIGNNNKMAENQSKTSVLHSSWSGNSLDHTEVVVFISSFRGMFSSRVGQGLLAKDIFFLLDGHVVSKMN